jgi:hypothetical protein
MQNFSRSRGPITQANINRARNARTRNARTHNARAHNARVHNGAYQQDMGRSQAGFTIAQTEARRRQDEEFARLAAVVAERKRNEAAEAEVRWQAFLARRRAGLPPEPTVAQAAVAMATAATALAAAVVEPPPIAPMHAPNRTRRSRSRQRSRSRSHSRNQIG